MQISHTKYYILYCKCNCCACRLHQVLPYNSLVLCKKRKSRRKSIIFFNLNVNLLCAQSFIWLDNINNNKFESDFTYRTQPHTQTHPYPRCHALTLKQTRDFTIECQKLYQHHLQMIKKYICQINTRHKLISICCSVSAVRVVVTRKINNCRKKCCYFNHRIEEVR